MLSGWWAESLMTARRTDYEVAFIATSLAQEKNICYYLWVAKGFLNRFLFTHTVK